MTANMWLSKDDVLKDLAECTGVWMNDFDDGYIVRGSRPPPPAKLDDIDDEEMKLRFGGCGDHVTAVHDNGPDLAGITKMLRMVDQDRYSPPKKRDSPLKHAATEIIISKLNPNVQEFVPKAAQIEDQMLDKKDDEMTNNIEKETEDIKTSHNIDDTHETIKDKIKEVVKISQSTEELEKQKKVALLKSKITTASKDESIEKKIERNVAMATLLRLNSGSPKLSSNSSGCTPKEPLSQSKPTESSDQSTNTKPLVLFTPDYFAGPSNCTPKVVNVKDCEHAIPEPIPLQENSLEKTIAMKVADPEIKKSIDKVKQWLNSPEKKAKAKGPVAHIGPVIFKKKEPVSSSRSSSSVSTKAEPVHMIPAFVPSKYAAELAKDFEARVKAKEEEEKKKQPPQDMWTKLEMELKAKDEIIKNRLKEKFGDTSIEDADTSNSTKNSRSSSRN